MLAADLYPSFIRRLYYKRTVIRQSGLWLVIQVTPDSKGGRLFTSIWNTFPNEDLVVNGRLPSRFLAEHHINQAIKMLNQKPSLIRCPFNRFNLCWTGRSVGTQSLFRGSCLSVGKAGLFLERIRPARTNGALLQAAGQAAEGLG